MKNGIFTLGWRDIGLGLIVAVASPLAIAIFAVLGAVVNAPSFDAWSVDYGTLFHNLVNTSIVVSYGSFSGYIIKNLLTTTDGKFLGIK